jgi:hypothetical protein
MVPVMPQSTTPFSSAGTMPAYKAKWYEVTDTLFRLPVGFTASIWAVNLKTWNSLNPATQALLKKEIDRLTEKSWKAVEAETNEGVACTTGTGACSAGAPGKLKLVLPSEADLAARDKVLVDVVLPSWAARCGTDCVKKWNEMVGKKIGMTAKAN